MKLKFLSFLLFLSVFNVHGIDIKSKLNRSNNLNDFLFPINSTFDVMDSRFKNRNVRFTPSRHKQYQLRVLGIRNKMYVVEVYENGEKLNQNYLVSKKWAHKTMNIAAVLNFIRSNSEVADNLNPPVNQNDEDCEEDTKPPQLGASNLEDAFSRIVRTKPPKPIRTGDFMQEVELIQKGAQPSSGSSCEVLDQQVSNSDKSSLNLCFNSIRNRIVEGARGSNGKIDRNKLFCNLYSKLSPNEQEFAAMMFTSIGEAGIISKSRSTSPPSYQEQLFVMKVMDNRAKQAQKDNPGKGVNSLDIALARSQFSMFNSSIFNRNYRPLFEPNNNSYNKDIEFGIDAFMSLKNNLDLVQPKPDVDRIDSYYNPHGMSPPGRVPDWVNSRSHVRSLNYNGVPVRTTRPYMHKFYSRRANQPLFYGSKRYFPPSWRNQCGN